ncbi:MAG: T9SS type A sorting domain-containing protein [Bacteroidota bacterium]
MKKDLLLRKTIAHSFLFFILLLNALFSFSQGYKGKDGAKTYSVSGTYIPNRYAVLASSVSSGASSIDVTDINQLKGSYSFTNASNPYISDPLSSGDLIMIIQMQGADISIADDASYGSITTYNNTGNYELREVLSVTANTIVVCPNLTKSYSESGRMRTQVVRVPRLSSLTIGTSAIISGAHWNGTTGGVIALEVSGNTVLNGTISAGSIGFRGGTDIMDQSDDVRTPHNYYVTGDENIAASKGEGIAGNFDDYNNLLNGSYGRGAPANGGGGGNGHNSGGGGGSNAGFNNTSTWNGTGVKNTSTSSWTAAWELESSGFSTDASSGGGRGGYSFSYGYDDDDNAVYPDPLLLGPGDHGWYGDYRQNVGGFGGRPLEYIGARLFMGGGGGSGDGNDNASGFGGNGGGIIYMLSNGDVSGTGSVSANGHNGYDTHDDGNDAAGGGGGGGAIIMLASGTLSGISVSANGGNGGNQAFIDGESEGPGGGGGGGLIQTTSSAISKESSGGTNGVTLSNHMTNFLPDGATMGSDGTVLTASFADIANCTALPLKLLSFTAALESKTVALKWTTEQETNSNRFEVEKSYDGKNFSAIATVFAANSSSVTNYFYKDELNSDASQIIYYRLKMIDNDGKFTYSHIKIIRFIRQDAIGVTIYPNPSEGNVYVTLPKKWQGKRVEFSLFDITGKLVQKTETASADATENIGLQRISNGIYLLRISNRSETIHKQIVKR